MTTESDRWCIVIKEDGQEKNAGKPGFSYLGERLVCVAKLTGRKGFMEALKLAKNYGSASRVSVVHESEVTFP